MSSEVQIPFEAYGLAHHVYRRGAVLDADALDSALEKAAPLIVAAELDRLADQLKPEPKELVDFTSHGKQYHSGVEFACGVLRRRASELRGEGKDGETDD